MHIEETLTHQITFCSDYRLFGGALLWWSSVVTVEWTTCGVTWRRDSEAQKTLTAVAGHYVYTWQPWHTHTHTPHTQKQKTRICMIYETLIIRSEKPDHTPGRREGEGEEEEEEEWGRGGGRGGGRVRERGRKRRRKRRRKSEGEGEEEEEEEGSHCRAFVILFYPPQWFWRRRSGGSRRKTTRRSKLSWSWERVRRGGGGRWRRSWRDVKRRWRSWRRSSCCWSRRCRCWQVGAGPLNATLLGKVCGPPAVTCTLKSSFVFFCTFVLLSCRSGRVSELWLCVLVSGVGAERNFQADEGEQSSGERYLPAADRGTAVYSQVPLYVYTCTKVTVQSFQKNAEIFLWLLQVKILDYVACFLKKCDGICRIFMQFYVMKLQEFAKTAVWWKREKKSDSPNTLFSLGYYL